MYGIIYSSRVVYFVAAFISILISFWIFKQTEIINPDGVCYVQSAASMSMGLHYAMHLCGQAAWPFYSILIFGVQFLTNFSTENSAYFLDAIFTLISVLVFIRIIQILSQHQNRYSIVWLGAIVILFSPIFNDVRHYIVRDHGYFAFYLSAILFLLLFFQINKWLYALGWGLASIVATLFRIEGAIFLALIPFTVFLDFKKSMTLRLYSYFQLNALSLIIIIMLCVLLGFYPDESLGRFREINLDHALKFLSVLQSKSEILKEYILNKHAMVNPKIILFFTVIVWYLYSAISNVSFFYTLLIVFAWWKKLLKIPSIMNIVVWSYLLINVILTLLFLATNMFISKRYLVAQSLTLMMWVPFALDALLQQWKSRRFLATCIILLLVFTSLSGLIEFGYSKKYIREAGIWLQQHASSNAHIYSNDLLVKYYSKHFGKEIFLEFLPGEKINFSQYDYLAIRQNKKNKAGQNVIPKNFQLMQVFHNYRGDEVIIYQRKIQGNSGH